MKYAILVAKIADLRQPPLGMEEIPEFKKSLEQQIEDDKVELDDIHHKWVVFCVIALHPFEVAWRLNLLLMATQAVEQEAPEQQIELSQLDRTRLGEIQDLRTSICDKEAKVWRFLRYHEHYILGCSRLCILWSFRFAVIRVEYLTLLYTWTTLINYFVKPSYIQMVRLFPSLTFRCCLIDYMLQRYQGIQKNLPSESMSAISNSNITKCVFLHTVYTLRFDLTSISLLRNYVKLKLPGSPLS